MNGTTNFILSKMAASSDGLCSFADALAEAQGLGYAEGILVFTYCIYFLISACIYGFAFCRVIIADPSADVGGGDVACKLSVVSRLAFNTSVSPDSILTQGITDLIAYVTSAFPDSTDLFVTRIFELICSFDFDYLRQRCGGATIKLLGMGRMIDSRPALGVSPAVLSPSHPLFSVRTGLVFFFVLNRLVVCRAFFYCASLCSP
jgi:homoserine dehydrogenase